MPHHGSHSKPTAAWRSGLLSGIATLADRLSHGSRHALRSLARAPGYTAAALCILGVGIGANTAVFSVVHKALYSPTLPYANVDRTVWIYGNQTEPAAGRRPGVHWLSYPEFVEFGKQPDLFAHAAALSDGQVWSLQVAGRTSTVLGEVWSPALFSIIDFTPAQGRQFLPDEDRAGSPSVVIVSHAAWRRLFGGDPNIVGTSIRLNGCPVTVVGVGPPSFAGTLLVFATDFWIPWGTARTVDPDFETLDDRSLREVRMLAAVQPGVAEAQARAHVSSVGARLARAYPNSNAGLGMQVFPAADVRLDPEFDRALVPLSIFFMAVVGLALLVACSNLAGMLLSRSLARRRDIAIRLALGATRRRVIGEMLSESVVLGLLGGAVGVVLAVWSVYAVSTFDLPVPVTLTINNQIGGAVLAYAFLLSVGASVLFGAGPALRATRGNSLDAIKNPGAIPSNRNPRFTLQNLLVVGQVAGSVVLLVTSGLFLRSIAVTNGIDVPFESRQIAFVSLDSKRGGLRTEAEGRALLDRYRERVAALPGVESIAFAHQMPLSLWGMDRVPVEGSTAHRASGATPESVSVNVVSPEYFSTMGIPVLRGRGFTTRDAQGAPRVIIVNETMAQEWFGGGIALGAQVRVGAPGSDELMEVVGVARNVPVLGLSEPSRPAFYMPFDQAYRSEVTVIARTSADPAAMRDVLQRELQQLNPLVPILESRTMAQQLEGQTAVWTLTSRFLSVFGLGTLALAGVGLFGLVSFSVGQRTKEIGIRIALGATSSRVIAQILRRGLTLFAVGTGVGLSLAALATRPLARVLSGVSPADPATYGGVVFVLAVACGLATYLPARRAARVDPMISLRLP